MRELMKRMALMLENKLQTEIRELPLPSPGRDGDFISDRKRTAAPANIVQKEQKKIRMSEVENDKEKLQQSRKSDESDPMVCELQAAVAERERRLYDMPSLRNEKMIAQLQRLIDDQDESSISTASFDDDG